MDDKALCQAILYVADQSREDPGFGRVKLNKILFFADAAYYAKHRRSATGFQYKALPRGPVADGLDYAWSSLCSDGHAEEEQRPVGDFVQQRLVPKAAVETNAIPDGFKDLLDTTMQQLSGKGAKSLSHDTHKLLCWRVARQLEVIPLGAVFLDTDKPTDADRAGALSLR